MVGSEKEGEGGDGGRGQRSVQVTLEIMHSQRR